MLLLLESQSNYKPHSYVMPINCKWT